MVILLKIRTWIARGSRTMVRVLFIIGIFFFLLGRHGT